MAHPKKTLYEILGVPRDADELDIKLAHERRVAEMRRAAPPDPSMQALVQQAFEVLSNEKRRVAYDAQLLTAAERSAAAEQATTDLEIGEEEAPRPKLPWVPIAVVAVIVVAGLLFVQRKSDAPKPAPEPVAAAPKPAAPPPPRERTAAEVLGSAATSTGRVMVYSMAGNATPIGLGTSTEPGALVTTCHAIPAGGKVVAKVGKEQFPADLTITDETLDLCRLSLAGFTTPPLKISTAEPKVGDKVYTLGVDAAGEFTAAEGTIKALRVGAGGALLELTTPVRATGAGVFDQYGALLGIATGRHELGPNVHIAIPATAIAQMRTRTK